MSGLKLLPLFASVGLVMASYASLVASSDGHWISHLDLQNGDSHHTPASLSELGDLEGMDWVRFIRKLYSFRLETLDHAFELLKKLDKISESLGGDGSTQIDERKLAELIEVNRSKNDQYCTRNNLEELELLQIMHNTFVLMYENSFLMSDRNYHKSVERYFDRRRNTLKRLCKSYVLEDLNKRVASLNDADKTDMSLLGEQLARAEQKERLTKLVGNQEKCSAIWIDILLKFFEEKEDKNSRPKCSITGKRARECFKGLWRDRVVGMCSRWEHATSEVMSFGYCQSGDCTKQQTSWIDFGRVCRTIRLDEYLLAESLYNEFERKSSNYAKLKSKLNSGFKKLSCSGCNQSID